MKPLRTAKTVTVLARLVPALLASFILAGAAQAQPSEAERAARWADLRHAIFGERTVEDAGDRLAIEAPMRAEDAAVVPVAIRSAEPFASEIRGLYLVIDDNPSPLAAHFIFGPLADTRKIATRVRIDDYTYLHAVAETADGHLYATARFIKAAGGCSAPATADQALAQKRLGQMKLVLAPRAAPDAPLAAKLLISHPNSSGLQMDPLTRNYIPADFVQTVEVTYDGKRVFRLDSDIAISEDPAFNFSFRPADAGSAGTLTAAVLDSSQRHFTKSWPVSPAPQM
ncbi:MAG TPA: quinoprotein dehydrogenase-associated SoxYZ-like carrier [Stellaceae bacterium]